MRKLLFRIAALLCATLLPLHAESPRKLAADAMIQNEDADAQAAAVRKLVEAGPEIIPVLREWKEGGIYMHMADDGTRTPVLLTGEKDAEGMQPAVRYADGTPLQDAEGKPVLMSADEAETVETDSALRKAMKDVIDFLSLTDADAKKRMAAVQAIGLEQDPDKLPALQERSQQEQDSGVKRALRESIALIQLRSENKAEQIAACNTLGELESIASQDALKTLMREAEAAGSADVAKAAKAALEAIASHLKMVDTVGTVFRGLSSGSVLLVVAIGLAITFGLMGVINMAHGELIAVGAYTTYLVQNVFAGGLALSPFGISMRIPGFTASDPGSYFLMALPCSFLAAALVGILLERTVIRFLYRRPLESLLATWGVSLVLQQLFRFTFGSNNVQVDSPSWLSGNWTVSDVQFGWNRLFVIGFAVLIIAGTSLVLRKTSLGLLIRAVMQNRNMAACMGVRTDRVNMLTFGFGSGLAGLAGAFLSQIGNVGPSLGQSYIVDAFMTVVVGGVGNLMGTVLSALGIGIIDQSLQQVLGNPVLGKIFVLTGIILFLQFKPAGLFVTRSRSLES